MLDDLGHENMTAACASYLHQIIDYRYVHKLQTIVTTNAKDIEELCDWDKEEYVKPMVSRILERGKWVTMANTEDYRMKGSRESRKSAEEWAMVRSLSVVGRGEKRGVFDRIGEQPYFAEVASNDLVVFHAEYYAEIVQNVSLHRQVVEAGYKISRLEMKLEKEGGELMDKYGKNNAGVSA